MVLPDPIAIGAPAQPTMFRGPANDSESGPMGDAISSRSNKGGTRHRVTASQERLLWQENLKEGYLLLHKSIAEIHMIQTIAPREEPGCNVAVSA